MKRGKIIGSAIIVACVAVAAISLSGAATPHVTFAQAKEARESCQVYGKLLKDSIRMQSAMTEVAFTLEDKKTGERLPCYYKNVSEPVPANFVTATEVRALGIWSPNAGEGGAFVVSQMQTKCPSKYDSGRYEEKKSGLPDPKVLGEPRKPGAPTPSTPDAGRN